MTNTRRTRFLSTLSLAAVLAACGGSYTNPGTGETKKWSFDDDATPEEKREAYEVLEREKATNESVLRIHRESPKPDPETIALCNSNLEEIAEAKADLEEQGYGK